MSRQTPTLYIRMDLLFTYPVTMDPVAYSKETQFDLLLKAAAKGKVPVVFYLTQKYAEAQARGKSFFQIMQQAINGKIGELGASDSLQRVFVDPAEFAAYSDKIAWDSNSQFAQSNNLRAVVHAITVAQTELARHDDTSTMRTDDGDDDVSVAESAASTTTTPVTSPTAKKPVPFFNPSDVWVMTSSDDIALCTDAAGLPDASARPFEMIDVVLDPVNFNSLLEGLTEGPEKMVEPASTAGAVAANAGGSASLVYDRFVSVLPEAVLERGGRLNPSSSAAAVTPPRAMLASGHGSNAAASTSSATSVPPPLPPAGPPLTSTSSSSSSSTVGVRGGRGGVPVGRFGRGRGAGSFRIGRGGAGRQVTFASAAPRAGGPVGPPPRPARAPATAASSLTTAFGGTTTMSAPAITASTSGVGTSTANSTTDAGAIVTLAGGAATSATAAHGSVRSEYMTLPVRDDAVVGSGPMTVTTTTTTTTAPHVFTTGTAATSSSSSAATSTSGAGPQAGGDLFGAAASVRDDDNDVVVDAGQADARYVLHQTAAPVYTGTIDDVRINPFFCLGFALVTLFAGAAGLGAWALVDEFAQPDPGWQTIMEEGSAFLGGAVLFGSAVAAIYWTILSRCGLSQGLTRGGQVTLNPQRLVGPQGYPPHLAADDDGVPPPHAASSAAAAGAFSHRGSGRRGSSSRFVTSRARRQGSGGVGDSATASLLGDDSLRGDDGAGSSAPPPRRQPGGMLGYSGGSH